MSPRVFKQNGLIFWFHSYDVQIEDRPSIHVGKGSQSDAIDAKIWLEPQIEIARSGRSLSRAELQDALRIIDANLDRIMEAWHAHKGRTAR
jgi:hypothetical protein